MSVLTRIALPKEGLASVALADLGSSHGLTRRSAIMYERFYGLTSVVRHVAPLEAMLSDALGRAVGSVSRDERPAGTLIYCKTQTHNTLADGGMLRRIADAHGLWDWDVASLSMTSCASALVQMHVANACSDGAPMIVLTGEKAFHPWVSRLPVGLLAEVPAAALFNAGPGSWRVAASSVKHLPRFHQNPDAMSGDDRRALQDVYADAMIAFVEDMLDRFTPKLRPDLVFLPHNLNRPMTDAVIRHFGWDDRTFHGDLPGIGHAYCSDGFVNLDAFERAGRPERQALVLAAGTGVTFAACLLDRLPTPEPERGQTT